MNRTTVMNKTVLFVFRRGATQGCFLVLFIFVWYIAPANRTYRKPDSPKEMGGNSTGMPSMSISW